MKQLLCAVAVLAVVAMPVPSARAASNSECAIWLCLPFGFAIPGCDKARDAMFKRMFKFKGPVPSWSSCAVGAARNDDMKIVKRRMAFVDDFIHGPVLVRDESCRDGTLSRWCVDTFDGVQSYQNGQPIGDEYVSNSARQRVNIDGIPYLPVELLTPPDDERYCQRHRTDAICSTK